MSTPAHQYAQDHAERFEAEYLDLLRIPSVSTLAEHAADVHQAAEWIAGQMRQIGLTDVQKIDREGFLPLVYGHYDGAGAGAPTVLVYCHYDVQPAEMADGWITDPFTPTLKDGKVYARGAVDSKCHIMAHLKAIESMLETGGCAVNVKFLFEGEEESGSKHIYEFIPEHLDLLQADVCVVSDGSMPDPDQPVLCYGLRGIVTAELVVTGPQRDLHSGHFGGNVHNPLQALAEIIAQLHDEEGQVTVPGFYDNVREITANEHEILKAYERWMESDWKHIANAPKPWGEPYFMMSERMGARPTLEINGMAGGFYGEGFKTVIPHRAVAKISCRLVPDQDPNRIFGLLRDYIAKLEPPTVSAELVELEEGAPGVLVDLSTPAIQAVVQAYGEGWGREPVLMRGGGSVPVIAKFQQHLGIPVVMMPFGIGAGGAHGPNEYMILEMFHKGISTIISFDHIYARQGQ